MTLTKRQREVLDVVQDCIPRTSAEIARIANVPRHQVLSLRGWGIEYAGGNAKTYLWRITDAGRRALGGKTMRRPTKNQAWALGRVRGFSDRRIPVCQTGLWSGVSLPMMRALAKHGWVEESAHTMSGWPPIEIKGWRLTENGRRALEEGKR